MPLEFDERGLLTLGFQPATLEEVQQHFGRFQGTSRRSSLFENLRKYIEELESTGWEYEILVDGSFVMKRVDEPDDIDVILILPHVDIMNKTVLLPFELNVLDKNRNKRTYKIEVIPVRAGSIEERSYKELFAQVRKEWSIKFNWPIGIEKGIVRLTR